MVKNPLSSKAWRAVISAFIVFHLYIMAIWGLPGSNFRSVMARPIEKWVLYSGLWHSWDMFSPDPLALNFRVQAEITYQDHSTKIWEFPRMEKLSIWQRFQKERYRKWRERVRQDAWSGLWDDTCRFIARLNDTPTNHPVRIALVRYWEPIPLPMVIPGTARPRDFQPMPAAVEPRFHYKFHYYEVDPGDL